MITEDKMEKNETTYNTLKEILLLILLLTGLYLTSFSNYLLFHSLVEIFSITVAVCIFIIAWNSRNKIENNYLLFTGISFLFISAIDLLHTLAYKGMGVFPDFDTNLPTQLWIAARYLQSISFLIAPLFLFRKLKHNLNLNFVFLIYSIVFSILIGSIFIWKIFPDCFIEGKGLTTFKIVSEYVISLIMGASIYLLYKNRKEFDTNIFSLLVASIIILVFSELSFTAYASVFGFANMLGHLFKFIAFYLIYKAIIVMCLRKPYDLIFRDLKKSEDELIKKAEELSRAYSKLKEVDKLKSMFIASMSHELRTPLNSIIGFSGMTLQGLSGELNDEQKDNLARVTKSAKHLLSLITDVIDISKIEAGRIEITPEPFELGKLITEAVNTIQPQLKEKGLELIVNVPSGINMNTDRKRLLQCLLNYLGNAVKFSEVGTVTISAREINGDVEISVMDTGIGIAEKDMPRLFEAFERIDTHLRIKAGGSGLGLYLTKKLSTEILRGSVGVKSVEGKGSTFSMRIPKVLRKIDEDPQISQIRADLPTGGRHDK